MPKYKPIKEGVLDNFVSAVFTRVGKGVESAALKKIAKSDPDLAKQFKDLQDTKKRLEKTLDKKTKQAIKKGEVPDYIKNFGK